MNTTVGVCLGVLILVGLQAVLASCARTQRGEEKVVVSNGDRRLVQRQRGTLIEEGQSEGQLRIGTWRYSRPATGEIVEEVDYHEGKPVRCRRWHVLETVLERDIIDGSTWMGPEYRSGKQGQWVRWTSDLKLDCEASGLYIDGVKLVNFEVTPGGLFQPGDLWNNNDALRRQLQSIGSARRD